ncbi:hypothetical protein FGB62_50g227 [Gracilaria domingensis]|nr:hypothetical protein FGB62_50g227 [Gracilaria domingensis]
MSNATVIPTSQTHPKAHQNILRTTDESLTKIPSANLVQDLPSGRSVRPISSEALSAIAIASPVPRHIEYWRLRDPPFPTPGPGPWCLSCPWPLNDFLAMLENWAAGPNDPRVESANLNVPLAEAANLDAVGVNVGV